MRSLRWISVVLTLLLVGTWAARASRGPAVPVDDAGQSAWSRHLAAVDRAVARDDVSEAVYQWRHAYVAALHSREWGPLVAAGDAALRIDALSGIPGSTSRAEARQAYLDAVLRAAAQRDAEGILRVGDALAGLGDAGAAARARRMAGALQARRGDARGGPLGEPHR